MYENIITQTFVRTPCVKRQGLSDADAISILNGVFDNPVFLHMGPGKYSFENPLVKNII